MFRWVRTVALLLMLSPAVAPAATIYVNNVTGDNRANGLFPEIRNAVDGPVATISRALEIALAIDSIEIANTGIPYHESLVLNGPHLSGTARFPFVIEGNNAVVRGLAPLAPDVWRRVAEGTYRYQPYRKGHYQLFVAGTPAEAVVEDRASASPPYLQPLQWTAFRGHVYFRVEPHRFIDQYPIEVPAHETGLAVHNMRNVIVRNLQIEGFRLDGVSVSGNSRNIRLVNVRSVANGRAGLVATGTSHVEIGGLDLEGNRVAEHLELLEGKIIELPAGAVPPKPQPVTWDVNHDRYGRVAQPAAAFAPTARSETETR